MNFQIRSRLKEPNRDFETFNTFEKDTTVIHVSDLFEDNYVEHYIISDILGGGLNSPLYQEIREKRGLAYSISSWVQEEGFKQHAFGISSQTEKQNTDEMQDCIQEVIKNPKKYLTKERYEIVIKSVHINLKKSEISRYKNIGRFISPKERDIKLKIDDITYDKLLDCYEKTIQNHDFYKSVDQEGTKEGVYLYS
mgnify:CR=1 FL=1